MMSRKLAPWSPWRSLDRFFEEGILEEGLDFTPLVDIYQKKDEVIVETPLTKKGSQEGRLLPQRNKGREFFPFGNSSNECKKQPSKGQL